MIFKERDSAERQIEALEQRLKHALELRARKQLQRDLQIARAGLNGEKEAAYHIDFHLRDSKNWAVIHDLRIEHNGRVAQIDHLLIDRILDIFVIESKSFRTKIRHANGGWDRLNFNRWEGIPSPVEQNDRHILVLKELLEDRQLAPTRFGIGPRFLNVVVVQPSCSIIGSIPDDARVYRMDNLVKQVKAVDVTPLDLLKAISQDSLHSIARALVDCHAPVPTAAVNPPHAGQCRAESYSGPDRACQACNRPVSDAEAAYCRASEERFRGKVLCRKCQGYLPKEPRRQKRHQTSCSSAETLDEKIVKMPECAACGREVEQKVVNFCRVQSKRFGGRILCRMCQKPSSCTAIEK